MAVSGLVQPTDPRLGLPVAPASPGDPMTHAAVRLLGDVMAQLRTGALSAPAVGVPVSLIALRDLDVTRYFLNPTIRALGPCDSLHGEVFCLTGPIRRNTERARWLALRGIDLAGTDRTVDLEDDLALQVQQALDLLHGRPPDTWLTPFHRAWLAERKPERRDMFQRVNAGLDLGQHGRKAVLRQVDAGTLQLMSDDGASAVGPAVDIENPVRPTQPGDRHVLALFDALPAAKRVLFASPVSSGLLVAALLVHRGLTAFVSSGAAWPYRAFQQLGLRASLQEHPFEPASLDPSGDRFHAILIDGQCNGPEVPRDRTMLCALARVLDAETGVALFAMQSPDAGLEEALQSAFQAIYAIGGTAQGTGTLYLAAKKTPDISAMRAMILSASRTSDLSDRSAILRGQWTHLRKDGKREQI